MVDDKVRAIFERAGCTGSPPARSLGGETEFGPRAEECVAPASVVKALVALVAETWLAEGRLDPRERVTLAADERSYGPAGVSPVEDDAVLSWRDSVVPMPTVGDDPSAGQDLGHAGRAEPVSRSDRASARESARADERLAPTRALTPGAGTRTTPRDMVTPLRLIRSGQAGPADACAPGHGRMARQLTRHRIASAFRTPVRAAKSGGLAGIVRNEVGVVSFPGGRRYAAAVLTTSRPGSDDAAGNAATEAATARTASRAHRTTFASRAHRTT
ncbi:serine hydrolase [Streptomyces sp. F-1]|uniref:serine hydrolase n=1 Tax=Streptomyces sp. F-1 TaxID=463642 RepID=UPI0015A6634E|nr:serine hydrolase [Streptomyces sp. F-1]